MTDKQLACAVLRQLGVQSPAEFGCDETDDFNDIPSTEECHKTCDHWHNAGT